MIDFFSMTEGSDNFSFGSDTQDFNGASNVSVQAEAIAPIYSENETYSVGSYVMHNGLLYICVEEILTTEPWNPSHWELATVSSAIEDINDQGKAPVITDTASGAVAHIADGADGYSVKDLTIGIESVQSGTGDPSPTNIRAISGWAGARLTKCKKNLLKNGCVAGTYTKSGVTITCNADGSIKLNNTATANAVLILNFEHGIIDTTTQNFGERTLPPGKYRVEGMENATSNCNLQIAYTNNASGTSGISADRLYNGETFEVKNNYKYNYIRLYCKSGTSFSNAVIYPMIVPVDEIDNSYEKFDGTTVEITFPDDAGIVYGGMLDATNGVLTVTHGSEQIKDLTLSYNSTGQYFRAYNSNSNPLIKIISTGQTTALCSCYPTANVSTSSGMDQLNKVYVAGSAVSVYRILLKDTDYTTVESFVQARGEDRITYELAEPLTYQLTPTEATTLLGINNIYADTGDTSVEYCADTKLYIQKLTQPTEDDMTANENIAINTFFMVGNNLYISTAAILTGETIIPGTNCTQLSLAQALNQLNA